MQKAALLSVSVFVFAGAAFGFQGKPAKKAPAKTKAPTYASVAPIMKSCEGCHHGERAAHGLDVSSYDSIMKGDKEGKVVVAGNPAKSRLATVLHGKPTLMPPRMALPAAQIATIEAWIKGGAKK